MPLGRNIPFKTGKRVPKESKNMLSSPATEKVGGRSVNDVELAEWLEARDLDILYKRRFHEGFDGIYARDLDDFERIYERHLDVLGRTISERALDDSSPVYYHDLDDHPALALALRDHFEHLGI